MKGVRVVDDHMLTTTDNPWNPFTHYNEWNAWDTANGYHTSSYLARVTKTSMDLSDADFERAIEDAMDEIVAFNPTGVYVKVSPPDANSKVNSET
jgi:hypothetical protein